MKVDIKLLTFLLCIALTQSCHAIEIRHRKTAIVQDDLKIKAEKLKDYYSKSINGKETIKYQKLFFDEFPDHFSQFDSLYGYKDDNKGDLIYTGILAGEAIPHIIDLFNNLKCISQKDYYNKLINISIGGHWEADGINYFLHGVQERALKNPSLIFKLLESRKDEDIKSFWYFFYDGPHPKENLPKEFDQMKAVYPRVYSLMEKAHKQVLKDADH